MFSKWQRASREKHTLLRLSVKRYQHLLGIVLGSLILLPGCTTGRNEKPADEPVAVGGVRCSEPTWVVGAIDPEKQLRYTHTFTVQNETDKTIPIAQLKPDCGCVVAEDGAKEIPANGSVGIKVGFHASPAPGGVRHAILVKLGGDNPASFLLNIRGTVLPNPGLVASPDTVDFGRLANGETSRRILRVQRYDFSKVVVTKLTCDIAGCDLKSHQAPDGKAILVSAFVRGASMRPGLLSGTIVVETDHPTVPSLQIPIKAEVGALADAFTSSVLIDSISPGARQNLSLYRAGMPVGSRPKITRLEYKGDPDVQVAPSSEGEDSRHWQAFVSVSRDAKVGVVKTGTLRIGVSPARTDDIEVPVTVFVK
ncbi:MAG: DUF1573 domain-containing protein [Gemmataceae bacterium]